jgi:hypothetical protein
MMKRVLAIGLMVVVCLACGYVWAQEGSKTLKVKVTYEGEGEVDSTHGIHLFLFDTPDIGQGAMPINMNSVFKNDGVISFSSIRTENVYLVGAYGDLSLMGPPPSGTPVSFYKPGQPTATAILMDKDEVEIHFVFDDSNKMP